MPPPPPSPPPAKKQHQNTGENREQGCKTENVIVTVIVSWPTNCACFTLVVQYQYPIETNKYTAVTVVNTVTQKRRWFIIRFWHYINFSLCMYVCMCSESETGYRLRLYFSGENSRQYVCSFCVFVSCHYVRQLFCNVVGYLEPHRCRDFFPTIFSLFRYLLSAKVYHTCLLCDFFK